MTGALMVVLLGSAEAALRMFPALMPIAWQLRNSEIQGGREYKPVPDREIGFLEPVTSGSDRLGFANPEPWPDQATIVFLGDSLLGGAGVGAAFSFPHLVGRMLHDRPVLNLGLAGAGVERQYVAYRRFGQQMHPRLVVAALYLVADFDNDTQFRAWRSEGAGTDYDTFRLAFGRRMSGTPEYVPPLTLIRTLDFGPLLRKSRLYVRTEDLVLRVRGGSRPEEYLFPDGSRSMLDERKLQFAAAPAEAGDGRIEALLAGLEKLRMEVTSQSAQLLVLLIPCKEELFGVSSEAADRNVVARTRERLRQAGLPVLDLYPALREAGKLQAPYFSDDIHLNAYGNRVVADEVVAWVNAQTDGLR